MRNRPNTLFILLCRLFLDSFQMVAPICHLFFNSFFQPIDFCLLSLSLSLSQIIPTKRPCDIFHSKLWWNVQLRFWICKTLALFMNRKGGPPFQFSKGFLQTHLAMLHESTLCVTVDRIVHHGVADGFRQLRGENTSSLWFGRLGHLRNSRPIWISLHCILASSPWLYRPDINTFSGLIFQYLHSWNQL